MRTLERAHGNIAEAARLAGLDRSNFRRVLARLEIDANPFRET
jgi:transcriptional regulator of acetoin/glycerol metabolism